MLVSDHADRISPHMSNQCVLVVDDDIHVISLIRATLGLDGYRILDARSGPEALKSIQIQPPDAVLLDVLMPGLDGFETLYRLREFSAVPVIMLTGKSEEQDKGFALRLGADDYLTKPFSVRELSMRVLALLRRAQMPNAPQRINLIIDERLSINFDRHEVVVEGRSVKLRPTEHRLLYHLVENAGWTVSHDLLLTKVWGYEYPPEPQCVRVYIDYLRKKIEADPSHPHYIQNERGIGYRFVSFHNTQGAQRNM